MKNTYENLDDIKRMQEEAFKRVQEMQKRAKRSLEYSQPYTLRNRVENQKLKNLDENSPSIDSAEPNTNTEEKIDMEQSIEEHNLNNSNHAKETTPSNDILSLLTRDSEKSLIMMLLMLLIEESTDINLVLALMYLIIN